MIGFPGGVAAAVPAGACSLCLPTGEALMGLGLKLSPVPGEEDFLHELRDVPVPAREPCVE